MFADDRLEEPDGEYWIRPGRLRCGNLGEDTFLITCGAATPTCEGSREQFEYGLLVGHQGWVAGWGGWEGDDDDFPRGDRDDEDLPEAPWETGETGVLDPEGEGTGTTGGDTGGEMATDGATSTGDTGVTSSSTPPATSGDTEGGTGEGTGTGTDGGTDTDGDDPPECSGSPLVVRLGDDPISLLAKRAGVRFDLLGDGRAVQTAWVQNGALLALDLDGNGRIDGGHELFGDRTRLLDGRKADDGFAALAQYDRAQRGGNGNGVLDAGDAVYAQLVLWEDRNADGHSSSDELQTLAEAGVVEFSLRASSEAWAPLQLRDADQSIVLWGSATLRGDRSTEVVDVWFDYGR